MGKCPTVETIVTAFIRDNGYDGLFEERTECACRLSNLVPCGEIGVECRAGHFIPTPDGADPACAFYIGNRDLRD